MADHIDLAPEFAAAWKGRDPFEAVSELEGEVFRKVKSRRTFRVWRERIFCEDSSRCRLA